MNIRKTAAVMAAVLLLSLTACADNSSNPMIITPVEESAIHTYVTIQGEDYDVDTTFSLNLYGCDVTGEDVAEIGKLKNLRELYLGGNSIDDVTPLSGLTNLTKLDLGKNQISDVTPLSGLTNLTELYLWTNPISDISPLAKLTGLTWLNLNDNEVSDISPLEELTGLTV